MAYSKVRRTFNVEHMCLECKSSFDDVHRELLTILPLLEPANWEVLARGEQIKVEAARRSGPKLWLFLMRDHGQLTEADGLKSKAIQYEIGNPLTAERMTRRQLAAGLYAPLRVYLYEDTRGRAIFEYDLPSSLFGQYGDDGVTAVGRELDSELEQALAATAGYGENPI
jgi:hypothetical protein